MFLVWFFLPVLFLLFFSGKVRERYFFIGFPAGFLFAGAALGSLIAALQKKGINAKRIRIALYCAVVVVVALQAAYAVLQNRRAAEIDVNPLRAKIALADEAIERLGNGSNLDTDLYCCTFPESEGRSVGLDYILEIRRKGKTKELREPGIYLVYHSESRPTGVELVGTFGRKLRLLRFMDIDAMTGFIASPQAAGRCADFWNIHDHFHWERDRERPFDKILQHGEMGPPQS